MRPPVELGVPEPEPQPVPGCDVCRALADQREVARAAGDWSRVSDINVELRAHRWAGGHQ